MSSIKRLIFTWMQKSSWRHFTKPAICPGSRQKSIIATFPFPKHIITGHRKSISMRWNRQMPPIMKSPLKNAKRQLKFIRPVKRKWKRSLKNMNCWEKRPWLLIKSRRIPKKILRKSERKECCCVRGKFCIRKNFGIRHVQNLKKSLQWIPITKLPLIISAKSTSNFWMLQNAGPELPATSEIRKPFGIRLLRLFLSTIQEIRKFRKPESSKRLLKVPSPRSWKRSSLTVSTSRMFPLPLRRNTWKREARKKIRKKSASISFCAARSISRSQRKVRNLWRKRSQRKEKEQQSSRWRWWLTTFRWKRRSNTSAIRQIWNTALKNMPSSLPLRM